MLQRIHLIEEAIDRQVRSTLQLDGGDIELVDVEGKNVYVKLRGACAGCPASGMTLKGVVESALREALDDDAVSVVEVSEYRHALFIWTIMQPRISPMKCARRYSAISRVLGKPVFYAHFGGQVKNMSMKRAELRLLLARLIQMKWFSLLAVLKATIRFEDF